MEALLAEIEGEREFLRQINRWETHYFYYYLGINYRVFDKFYQIKEIITTCVLERLFDQQTLNGVDAILAGRKESIIKMEKQSDLFND